jgi:tetratricopeptide (TPR) repeat protein
MSAWKLCLFLAVAFPLAALPTWGRADEAPANRPGTSTESEETRREVTRLFNEAETQYRLGNFDAALRGYQAALKLRSHPSLLFNVAQCYRQLKNAERALFFYKLFLSDWEREHPGTRPPTEAEVQRHIETLSAELQAAAEARRQALEEERLRAARLKDASARPALLRLIVPGVPQARILVDGAPRALTPVVDPLELKAGRRRIRVEAEGYVPWQQEVDVRGGQEITFQVALRPAAGRSRLWLATTIVGAALAIGAESLAVVYYGKAGDHFRDTSFFEDDRRVVITGHVLAGTFLAVAATSLVLYLRSGHVDDQASTGASVLPLPGGFAALGRFHF